MLSLISFLNNFKRDIASINRSDKNKKFLFKSITHLIISLEIASSSIIDEKINLLHLKSTIPSSIATELQIREVLNEGIKKKFFIKKYYFRDNKKPYYKMSKSFSLMITNWYLENKSKFN